MINQDIEHIINQMAVELKSRLCSLSRADPVMIGIHTGGSWIASRLHGQLELEESLGELNIAFYRDDFSRIGIHPRVTPSNLPFEIDDKHIILVDDVLHTGRTIRAALNEIFDYGRPASVILAVLVERSGRELPIQADVVGKSVTLNNDEHVKLSGPEPLALVIKKSA
jgi:pyrimidine operon attenuation protein/uracil phosphoribosyltransferase